MGKRIREGNDFVHIMSVERNGVPEDLTTATEIRLYLLYGNKKEPLTEYEIYDLNKVRVEFTPEMLPVIGVYGLELHYVHENASYADGNQKSAVDVEAFIIVTRTKQADDITELATVADVALGLMGKAFEFEDFTPEQLQRLTGADGITPDISFHINDNNELIATVIT